MLATNFVELVDDSITHLTVDSVQIVEAIIDSHVNTAPLNQQELNLKKERLVNQLMKNEVNYQ